MATSLTDDDIQAIATQVYNLILEGSANSIDYGEDTGDSDFDPPTTDADRTKYFLGVIFDDGSEQKAGNMNISDIFNSFGADAKSELDDYTDTKKSELETKSTAEKGELDSYTTTKKGELDTHAEELITDNLNPLVTQAETAKSGAESAKSSAESAKSSAETARDTALSYKNSAEDSLEEIETIKAQIDTIASTSDQDVYMTLDGSLYRVSNVFKSGLLTTTLTEVVESETA